MQAQVVNALEPEWEARFEPKSYGFRPGRGCHDAIGCIYSTVSQRLASRCWVLDADLAAAFDRIDHTYLLASLGGFPRWVFGDRDRGAYLLKFFWTKIVRHQMVPGTASPDDPALAEYWARRRQRSAPPLDGITLRLLKTQHGRCSLCGGLLLLADREPQSPIEWEQWLTVTRKAVRKHAITVEQEPGEPDETVAVRLVHAHCRRLTPASRSAPAGP